MSEKDTQDAGHNRPKKSGSKRIHRTRDKLGDALVGLMQEKEFDTISVTDVLKRAGVSRSTFYAHYSNKDDLFMSDADEFFARISIILSERHDQSNRVAPVREFFSHVREMRKFFAALVASGRVHENLELGRGHFARGIERRLKELPKSPKSSKGRSAMAFAYAGALLSLLTWWINHGMRESPEEMDDLFHNMVWIGLESRSSR